MATLNYTAITSLDGYIENEEGAFDWTGVDAEVHAYVNELERSIGTHLYGRRMYETMAVWQTIGAEPEAGDAGAETSEAGETSGAGADPDDAPSPEEVAYGEIWRALDKVVYSRTLDAVSTPRTRLEREFDPDVVRRLKDVAEHDISVSGPGLAQHAFAAGLVDEVDLFVCPVLVGGGKPGLPHGVRLDLELLEQHRFGNGVVHLRYRRR